MRGFWVVIRHVAVPLLLASASTPVYSLGPCSGLSCLIGCGKPPIYEDQAITPIHRSNTNHIGDVVQYKCLEGLEPQSGSSSSRCLQDGTWSPPSLQCTEQEPQLGAWGIHQCGPIPNLDHTLHDGGSHGRDTNSIVTYHCEEGYSGVRSRNMRYKCDFYNGQGWTLMDEKLKCQKMCTELNIPHGYAQPKGLTPFNSTVNVACEASYTLKGPAIQTCVENGQWEGALTECTEMCPELTIPHGFVKPKGLTPFNLMVSVTCEDGYTLKGSALQTCVEHGQWAGVLPECTVINCGVPRILHGNCDVPGGTTYESNAICSCDTGFHLNGSPIVRCSSLGTWNPALPICIEDRIEVESPTTTTATTTDIPPRPLNAELRLNLTMEIPGNDTRWTPEEDTNTVVIAMAASVGTYLLIVGLIAIGLLVMRKLRKTKTKQREDCKGNSVIYDPVVTEEQPV